MKDRQMKKTFKLLAIIFILLHSYAYAVTDDYCRGHSRGYQNGYKKSHGPYKFLIIPACDFPYRGMKMVYGPDNDYDIGYIIGFNRGREYGKE